MRPFFPKLFYLFICLCLAACSVDVSPGASEDNDAPKAMEDLAPMPEGYLDFAANSTYLFFKHGRAGIQDRLHPAMHGITGLKWATLEKLASDKADFDAAEYYGHGFDETIEGDVEVIIIQIKVPYDGGYNLVRVIMPLNEECCRIGGFEVEAKAKKTLLKLGE